MDLIKSHLALSNLTHILHVAHIVLATLGGVPLICFHSVCFWGAGCSGDANGPFWPLMLPQEAGWAGRKVV